ncbi:ABC transporter substrate-binding protein [Glutamicibacter sp.]|uniref:ABC transporter substrate-binding protein n=1 Tax=Glutamicibacter sp. TaxID=1931995 RepID=UPI002B48DEAA|nr:ABC transporter substrate-binding protein [Glutamicibacter sp.]HJX79261.1 ABC transporter substrate-binding protein [Glutamicibacter sp.]
MFDSGNPRPAAGGLQMLNGAVSRRSLLKFVGLGAAAVGSASLLTACGGSAGGDLTKFGVAAFPGDSFFIDTANLANKDYANHGLDVPKHLTPQSGVQSYQLLVAGAIDGLASDTGLLMATHANSSEGKRPVLIGFRTPETSYGIVAGEGFSAPPASASFEEKMASLKGKKVGVTSVGSGSDLQLKLALELAAMKYSDVTALAVGTTANAIPNLKQKRVDAYVTVQWTSTRYVAKESGGSVLLDFAEQDVPGKLREQAVLAVAVREEMAQQQPELVKQWLECQWDAHQWILNKPHEAAALLNKSSLANSAPDIARDYIEHYAQSIAPNLQELFKAKKETVAQMAAVAQSFGSIKKGQISYETLVPEFARA